MEWIKLCSRKVLAQSNEVIINKSTDNGEWNTKLNAINVLNDRNENKKEINLWK